MQGVQANTWAEIKPAKQDLSLFAGLRAYIYPLSKIYKVLQISLLQVMKILFFSITLKELQFFLPNRIYYIKCCAEKNPTQIRNTFQPKIHEHAFTSLLYFTCYFCPWIWPHFIQNFIQAAWCQIKSCPGKVSWKQFLMHKNVHYRVSQPVLKKH